MPEKPFAKLSLACFDNLFFAMFSKSLKNKMIVKFAGLKSNHSKGIVTPEKGPKKLRDIREMGHRAQFSYLASYGWSLVVLQFSAYQRELKSFGI